MLVCSQWQTGKETQVIGLGTSGEIDPKVVVSGGSLQEKAYRPRYLITYRQIVWSTRR